MKIYIIISAFNEEKRIAKVLVGIKKSKLPVIVVDDGSDDKTSKIAQSYGAIVLRHLINLGNSKGAAMKTGAEYAFGHNADAIIFMDADGQHNPDDLYKFIDKLESKHDVVFGKRKIGDKIPFIRLLGNIFSSYFVNILFGIKITDIPCGYRGLSRYAYNKVKWESIGYGVETEIVVRTAITKLKYCEVPVSTIYFDKYKGMTILNSFSILIDVFRWRFNL